MATATGIAGGAPAGEVSDRARKVTLFLLTVTYFFSYMDRQILAILLEDIKADLLFVRHAAGSAVRLRLRAVLRHARHPGRSAGRPDEPDQHHLDRARAVERDDRCLRAGAEFHPAAGRARRGRNRGGRLQPAEPFDHCRPLSGGKACARTVDLLARRDAGRCGGADVRRKSYLFLRLARGVYRHRPPGGHAGNFSSSCSRPSRRAGPSRAQSTAKTSRASGRASPQSSRTARPAG